MTAILFGSISTLADTSELQRRAFNDAFSQHGLGWEWDRDTYRSLLDTNGGARRIAAYAADRGEQVDADAVHATKSARFRELLGDGSVTARPGVAATIRAAVDRGVDVAVVTTTSADNVTALLAALADEIPTGSLRPVLDVSHVATGKPDPEVYEVALRELGTDAASCVAVEDNPGGVAAATAAGVTCVAFPNANTAGLDLGSAATTVAEVELDALLGHLGTSR